MKNLKKQHISKLDEANKRAIAFLNNIEEGNDVELEKLSLRKMMYTNLKVEKLPYYDLIRQFIDWELTYMDDSHFEEWVEGSTGNSLERWLELMYRWVNRSENNKDLKPYINPQKRREDLEKYFHLEAGVFHSRVLVYEGEEGHLYTIILYNDPKWADFEHIIMRGIDSIAEDEELKQGASIYGQEEWLKYNIEQNSEEVQALLKSYRYTTMVYIYYIGSSHCQFFTGTDNENIVIK